MAKSWAFRKNSLRDYAPKNIGIGESFPVKFFESTTITNLLEQLKIPKEEAKVVMVNGEIKNEHNYALEKNDEISIFPPVGGGNLTTVH